ncbi:MAG: tetratricopeptide repeat protein [Flavobacteriaceae bacterium]|nr:tetratricopeptide repeat protein [Flavobacteriaceae bacterium]
MKTKITFLFLALLFAGKTSYASNNEDCTVTLSLFAEAAKIENYKAALPYLEELRKNCASFHLTIYQYGERLYKNSIENAPQDQKMTQYNEYKKLLRERLQHFPNKTTEGGILADFAQVMFDNKIGSTQEQFDAFDAAYKKDKDNFTSPKALYTYFSLAIDLHDSGEKDIQEVFDLYDELIRKIEFEENTLASKITPLIEKQDAGETLNQSQTKLLSAGETNLKAYSQVKGSVNGKLGILADCENLIPLYERDFEQKKGDLNWLQGAAGRLSAKECEDPLFFKLVQELHNLNPSARSAYYLGQLAEADGKPKVALEYFIQSAELETDENRKANTYYKLAENYRKSGNSSTARSFYRKTLEAKPSYGRAYLQIARMYAESSNNCGETIFEKRAINWLAAEEARKAARVDPSVASNANAAAQSYMERAPQNADIFQEGMAGKTISFKCWVGGSVRVPNL